MGAMAVSNNHVIGAKQQRKSAQTIHNSIPITIVQSSRTASPSLLGGVQSDQDPPTKATRGEVGVERVLDIIHISY